MTHHPLTSLITASALALALLGIAGCDDRSGADTEQGETVPGSITDAPADQATPPASPAD
ncbi:hypothetical protein [Hoeflea ulvae]|uniref:Uncharacterized protein n=1 Tax=Hoeflea ulvae TaxID=2983764 RepID=A0ABT3YHR4_9HYPH|nr:hypothetical protein [Hoeflea ulvae]MCY0095439.1 hypothetical protein [Hoeflea ulvae]